MRSSLASSRSWTIAAAALTLCGCWESEQPRTSYTRQPIHTASEKQAPADSTRESSAWKVSENLQPRIRPPCGNGADNTGNALAGSQATRDGSALFDGARSGSALDNGPVSGPSTAGGCSQTEKINALALSEPRKITIGDGYVPAPDAVAANSDNGAVPVIKKSGAVDLDEFQRFQNALYTTIFPSLDKKDWGKKETKGNTVFLKPFRLTVHHTAGARTYEMDDSIDKMKGIQEYHMEGRAEQGKQAFQDIGYHFVIDGEGRIAEGRPTDVLGAHAGGANRGNIGISLMGNLNETKPTPSQQQSLIRLSAFLAAKYDIALIEDGNFDGHYRYGKTGCPGKTTIQMLPELRQRAAAEKESLLKGGDTRVGKRQYASFQPVNLVS